MAKLSSQITTPSGSGSGGRRAAASLRRQTQLRPTLAIVLGSGFGGVCERVRVACSISYTQLPGFPRVSVAGHAGRLVVGHLRQTPVLLLCGRAHYYEGHTMEAVTFPVRVLAEFGIRTLLLTNAAGGINPRFKPGDFMCLSDHINFMGANPLRGKPTPDATEFLDLSDTYNPTLMKLLRRASRNAGVKLHAGTYLAVSGPTYETPAEIRAFARLGADAIGMSTVPEAIVARQCGLAVAGLSCITNHAAGQQAGKLSHAEVLRTAAGATEAAARLLEAFAEQYAQAREFAVSDLPPRPLLLAGPQKTG
ncbi:MAG: purine-nucleoside phosphorylase [Pedosphaera parvula]|nr:purine-nucleoside phosphorylase [Pedosphaera parvula]